MCLSAVLVLLFTNEAKISLQGFPVKKQWVLWVLQSEAEALQLHHLSHYSK